VNLTALVTSFVLVFVAELGDKTLYTVLVLAARNRALPVLIGSWAAFVVQSGIALVLGSLLTLLPTGWIRWITAAVFLVFGLILIFKEEKHEEQQGGASKSNLRVALVTFGLVFAAEWGDATQIGSAALVARLKAPLQVFIGATLGLWAGAALAVILGRMVGPRLPERLLRRVAGILFCIFAVVSAVKSF
jgi:putative Ca2+/H+ antiporter (TMEM165/GDT1 family)